MSGDKPNHVYFANRANALLELCKFDECIADCDQSISIDETYVKAHFRKARALLSQGKTDEAMEVASSGLEKDPDNESIS